MLFFFNQLFYIELTLRYIVLHIRFDFEMMLQNYRLCQAVGQIFQTILSYKIV